MKKVILLGKGSVTRDAFLAEIETGQYTVYTLNDGPQYLPKNLHKYITHHFDLHDGRCSTVNLGHASKFIKFVHWNNPGCDGVQFPLGQVLNRFNLDIKHLTSTFTYMLLYAMYCNNTEILIAGLDYDTVSDRQIEELPGIMYLLGYANALGIKITLPEHSFLRKSKFYN